MQVGGGGQHVARGEGGQRRHGVRFRALLNTRLFGRMVDTEEEIIQLPICGLEEYLLICNISF